MTTHTNTPVVVYTHRNTIALLLDYYDWQDDAEWLSIAGALTYACRAKTDGPIQALPLVNADAVYTLVSFLDGAIEGETMSLTEAVMHPCFEDDAENAVRNAENLVWLTRTRARALRAIGWKPEPIPVKTIKPAHVSAY